MLPHEDSLTKLPPIDRNRELLKTAREEVYKTVGGHDLPVYFWEPTAEKAPPYPKSVIAFFFSSGWDNGQVSQFAPHCLYFASRGMTAMAFDYRVSAKHGSTPVDSMADVRSAMRWLRLNAVELGINPGKIVGAGGSGGAHMIAAAAMVQGFDEPGEDASISCAPNALALFNPVLDTSKKGFGHDRFLHPDEAKKANLMAAIAPHLPPTLIFHGTHDRVVPFEISEEFVRKMKKKKNVCELMVYEGQGHGFFNFNVSFDLYQGTLNALDDFLVTQAFIEHDPDMQVDLM
ncbi:alpha/beta hydrolase [Verrucomicrobium spinosum]|uniref:alpha/beta hydrolase n=1 Tax=Verrucomicrobium spinosum TaxID=2736 RepID=UPI00017463CD|nr:alpha/beta hydrolase [Verrucomicrobium spinosum]